MVLIAQLVGGPLQEREVTGSIHCHAIPKALKLVQVAELKRVPVAMTLLGAQHYEASTDISSLTNIGVTSHN